MLPTDQNAQGTDAGVPARPPANWGAPLAKVDDVWTAFEARLCAVVLVLEIVLLTFWIALKGLSTPADSGSAAGFVFRAIIGGLVLGLAAYWAAKNQREFVRGLAGTAGVVAGIILAKFWLSTGVTWSSNLLNWFNQASTLTLFGGLRGVGTRFTLLLALLGGSLATAAGKHITIDLVTRFVGAKTRLVIVLVGWVGSSIICFAAAWGFLDHIAIENFEAKAEMRPMEKVATVSHGLGEYWFVFKKQVELDLMSIPRVMKGEVYSDWMTGKEWNSWLETSGFVERFGKEKVEPLKISEDSKRSPIVVLPEKGEPRGELTNAANLVFPIGLFIIAVRFLILAVLAISGHRSTEPESFEEELKKAHSGAAKEEAV